MWHYTIGLMADIPAQTKSFFEKKKMPDMSKKYEAIVKYDIIILIT
jgi:hypothetical protein